MLAGKEPIGTIAVKDLAVAKKFYQGTLGLTLENEQGSEAHTYRGGAARRLSTARSSRERPRRPRSTSWSAPRSTAS